MEETKSVDAKNISKLPYNIRLDLARSTISGAVEQAQKMCNVDDATMALMLEAIVGDLRSNLVRAAAMQYALASDSPRTVKAGGKAAKVAPADPPEGE